MSNNDRTFHYIILNKPYGVLCQFSDSQGRPTLASLGDFPEDVYPVGRLDYDSEGLVLLTNDNELKHKILDPKFKTPKTYLAQVERIPDVIALEKLRKGVVIEGKKTLPAKVKLLEKEPNLSPRFVPIRFRKNIPTAWLEITIYEGRNRQVRKMTAAAGHPTLRLIRIKIGKIELDDLQCGKVRNIELKDLDNLY
ncbi:MAG: pseudouridine synthase [Bacteroidota bacterium]|nr:pseudouridine synthase [Bacteroidota bacterium]